MKRDIGLEKEVEKTIKKYNSIKKLPSAFNNSPVKRKLDWMDKLIIFGGILLFLFVCFRFSINKIDFISDRLNNIYNVQDLQPQFEITSVNKIYEDRHFLMNSYELDTLLIAKEEG